MRESILACLGGKWPREGSRLTYLLCQPEPEQQVAYMVYRSPVVCLTCHAMIPVNYFFGVYQTSNNTVIFFLTTVPLH